MKSETFTNPSMFVVLWAAEEARRLGSNQIDTEQMLLGIVDERNSVAAKTLELLGLTRATVRLKVEELYGCGTEVSDKTIGYTEQTLRVIEQSQIIANADNSQKIEPRHLLMGIIDDSTNRAVEILKAFDVNLVALRHKLWDSSEPVVGDEASLSALSLISSVPMARSLPDRPDIPVRNEGDLGSTISCRVKHKQRGGYTVMLANGKEAFLHSGLEYLPQDLLEVLVVQIEEHIVVTDKKELFLDWPNGKSIPLKFLSYNHFDSDTEA